MRWSSTIALALLLAGPVRGQPVGTCSPALAEAYLDIGNVRARILNNGNLFYRGEPHVYNVPKGSPSNAIFAGSIWIGGLVGGTLRMAASRYGPYEFWPGPLDEAGNPPADCAPYDRLFKVSKAGVEDYETTGTARPDLADWPTGLGAPTLDAAGHEIDLSGQPLAARQDRRIDLAAGERPSFLGDQMVWWVMNDMGNVHGSSHGDPVGVELPTSFALDTIWPNPFNPVATIRFGLPADAVATVDVVDVLGRRVAVIAAGARRAAGWHTVQFDGSRLASGVYFVRLVAGGRLDVKSVVLLK